MATTRSLQLWGWYITVPLLWLVPPLFANGVHHEALDALLYCTGFLNDGLVDHPGLYGFWTAIVYIQLAALSGWAVLHSKRPWRLWAVLALGGMINLLVHREAPTDRIRYEPDTLSIMFGLAAAHGDAVVAVRLVWMWLAARELARERKWHRAKLVALCVHPVVLGLGARWWDTSVVAVSVGLYFSAQWLREIRPLPKPEHEAVLGDHPVTSSQLSVSDAARSGADESDSDGELPGGRAVHEIELDGKEDEDGPEDSTLQ